MKLEPSLDDLNNRGSKGVELVICDGHKGIQELISRSFSGAAWAVLHVHLLCNLMKLIAKKITIFN